MILDFNRIVKDLDKAFIWSKSITLSKSLTNLSEKNENLKQWTAMIFGECGQGKSTTLNEIVQLFVENFNQVVEHGCNFKSMASFKSVT